MKLYQDTEKELFYETDYKPIPVFLRFSSCGYLSGLVGSTKYVDIDKAVSKALKAAKDRETIAQAIIEGFTVEQWFTANCK